MAKSLIKISEETLTTKYRHNPLFPNTFLHPYLSPITKKQFNQTKREIELCKDYRGKLLKLFLISGRYFITTKFEGDLSTISDKAQEIGPKSSGRKVIQMDNDIVNLDPQNEIELYEYNTTVQEILKNSGSEDHVYENYQNAYSKRDKLLEDLYKRCKRKGARIDKIIEYEISSIEEIYISGNVDIDDISFGDRPDSVVIVNNDSSLWKRIYKIIEQGLDFGFGAQFINWWHHLLILHINEINSYYSHLLLVQKDNYKIELLNTDRTTKDQPVIGGPKTFDDLFVDKKYVTPSLDLLRETEPACINDDCHFVGNDKGTVIVWFIALKRKIIKVPLPCDEVVMELMNQKFIGLNIKNGSIFGKPHVRANIKYKKQFEIGASAIFSMQS